MSDSPDSSATRSATERPTSSFAAACCAVLLALYAMYFARSLIVPILIAMFGYLTIRPVVRRARKLGLPPTLSAIVIMSLIALSFALATFVVFDPARRMLARAPQNVQTAKQRLGFIIERVDAVNDATDDLSDGTEPDPGEEKPVPVEIKQPAWAGNLTLVSGTGNFLSFVTISGVLLFFLLACGDDLLGGVMASLPDFSAKRSFFTAVANVQEGLSHYLAQVTAINCGLGTTVAIAMWLLGMPTPILWGVMAATFNYIPIVGAITGACIIFVVGLVTFEPLYYAFVVTGVFLTLTTIEGQVITPAILGRSMRMSPVLVFGSIVFWGWMWGLMGVLLSVPILIAIRMSCAQYDSMEGIAALLGGPPKSEADQSMEDERDEDEQESVPSESKLDIAMADVH